MILSIILIAYLLLLCDTVNHISDGNSNLLISSALVVLISWQQNTAWGITMLCVLSVICLIAMINGKR